MSIIFCEPLEQTKIISFYTYIRAKYGKLGGVIFQAPRVGIIVHSKNSRMNRCLLHDYPM